jgi:WD40 repeat protein
MQVLRAHEHIVDALAFSPDGRTLASCASSSVRLHDLSTGELVREWTGFNASSIQFLPDGSGLLLSGFDGLRMQPIAEEAPAWQIDGWCSRATLAPDGRTAAVHHGVSRQIYSPDAHRSVILRQFRTDSGVEIPGDWGGSLESTGEHRSPIGAPAFAPDGSLLAACFMVREGTAYTADILFWDQETSIQRGHLTSVVKTHEIEQIAFSPDGTTLAVLNGPYLRVRDARTHEELAVRKIGLQHFKAMAFIPGSRHVVTVSNDKSARLWDCSTWAGVRGYEWKVNKLRSVAVAPDGLRIAAGSTNGKIVVWDYDG